MVVTLQGGFEGSASLPALRGRVHEASPALGGTLQAGSGTCRGTGVTQWVQAAALSLDHLYLTLCASVPFVKWGHPLGFLRGLGINAREDLEQSSMLEGLRKC